LSLTPGTWIIGAKFTTVDLSASENEIACDFGNDSLFREVGSDTHQATTAFALEAAPPLTSVTTITLSCRTDLTSAYIDPGTELWAWKTSDAQTETVSACDATLNATPTNDALLVDSSQCQIGAGSFPTEVVGAQLGTGTWLAIAAVDGYVGSSDIGRCQLLDANNGKQLDAGSLTGLFETDGQITNLSVLNVKRSTTVEGRCGHDTASDEFCYAQGAWVFIKP
jgi:hypothetical protein